MRRHKAKDYPKNDLNKYHMQERKQVAEEYDGETK